MDRGDELLLTDIVWEHTSDAEFPYTAVVDETRYTIRLNDFPAEPLYTVMDGSEELFHLDDWPGNWVRPALPEELFAMLVEKRKPLTLPLLRAIANPLVPLESCSVCSRMPGDAEAAKKLRLLLGPINGWKPTLDQCTECHRLYLYESGYEYLATGSEDYTTYDLVDDVEALFHSDWFTRVRVADDELVGRVVGAVFPHTRRVVDKVAPRTFFRRHCLLRLNLDYGRARVWLALPDNSRRVTLLTGNREGLAFVAELDPPRELATRSDEYAAFVREVTAQ